MINPFLRQTARNRLLQPADAQYTEPLFDALIIATLRRSVSSTHAWHTETISIRYGAMRFAPVLLRAAKSLSRANFVAMAQGQKKCNEFYRGDVVCFIWPASDCPAIFSSAGVKAGTSR
jgi:hypothetical protein